jgi:outer membrane protein TolC
MRSSLLCVVAVAALVLASPAAFGSEGALPQHPLTLDECVALALRLNPSLTVAQQEVRSAEAGLQRSLASYYPSALVVGSRGRTGGTSFLETASGVVPFSTATDRREADVVLRHTLWETGRGESARRAQYLLEATAARREATVQDLAFSVSQLYYGALAAEQLVEVAEANLAAARDHEKLVQARAEVGESPPVDIVSAEAEVAQAEFGLIQSENDSGLAKAQLKREMGVPPTYPLGLSRPPEAPGEEAIPSLEAALQASRANRPELRATRRAVSAGDASLRLAQAVRWGGISLRAEYDRGITGPKEGADAWAAVLTATAFLFDGGSRAADVDAARAQVETLRAQEQELVNGVGLEVESALLRAETARRSVEAAEKSVASAQAQLEAAQVKYREGVGIFVEVLDAQETLVRARTNRVRAGYDYRTALVALKRAMGMLSAAPTAEVAP